MEQQENLSRRNPSRSGVASVMDSPLSIQNDVIRKDVDTKHRHGWYYKITERFHSMNGFIVVFAGCLFFYGMSVSYTNSMLVSIQRRFGFSTTQIGIILAMTEVGHIASALLVAHLVGNRNRPLWICIGGVLEGLAILLFAAPEIIFPRQLSTSTNRTVSDRTFLCVDPSTALMSNITVSRPACGQSTSARPTDGPLAVFITANILAGIGSTTPLILGLPYVDDNCSPKTVSNYYGFALAGRLIGPLVGFGVGAACAAVYIDFSTPPFPPSDFRWISAWYIGLLVIAAGLIFFGLATGVFPSVIKSSDRRNSKRAKSLVYVKQEDTSRNGIGLNDLSTDKHPGDGRLTDDAAAPVLGLGLKGLLVNLKRLLTSLAFLCRTSSMFVDGMVVAGAFHFLPLYFVQTLGSSQRDAAIYGGLLPLISIVAGNVTGGVVIKKFKLQPRHVALLLSIPSFVFAAGLYGCIGITCDRVDIVGVPSIEDFRAGNLVFNNSVCSSCVCSEQQYDPVCAVEADTNYFSPCHAGCKEVKRRNNTNSGPRQVKEFADCSCVESTTDLSRRTPENPFSNSTNRTTVRSGLCARDCTTQLYGITALLFIFGFFEGLPMPGQIMMQFRIVDIDLKNLCAAVTSISVAAFGWLPAPIFMGSIVDSTCRLWRQLPCGEHGNCLLYDTDQFRWKFFVTAASLKVIMGLLDAVVVWRVWNMTFERSQPLADNPLKLELTTRENSKAELVEPIK